MISSMSMELVKAICNYFTSELIQDKVSLLGNELGLFSY